MSTPRGGRWRLEFRGPLAFLALLVMLAGVFIPWLLGMVVLIRCLAGSLR